MSNEERNQERKRNGHRVLVLVRSNDRYLNGKENFRKRKIHPMWILIFVPMAILILAQHYDNYPFIYPIFQIKMYLNVVSFKYWMMIGSLVVLVVVKRSPRRRSCSTMTIISTLKPNCSTTIVNHKKISIRYVVRRPLFLLL